MAGHDGFIAWGMRVYRYVGGAYVKMPGLLEVTPLKSTVEKVATTHAESPSRKPQFIPGMFGEQQFVFKMNRINKTKDPTNRAIQDALIAASGDMDLEGNWKFEQYDNNKTTPVLQQTTIFVGWIEDASEDTLTTEGKVTMNCTVSVTSVTSVV
jgi:hypothetical protein